MSSSSMHTNRERAQGIAASPPSATVRSIREQIRDDIVTLRLRPGTRLSENELAVRFGTPSLREPDLLMVITGGEIAYTRPDGVKIIPIGCLKD